MPARFLMQQIEWREALDDARSLANVDRLQTEVTAARAQLLADCARALDVDEDLTTAVALVRSLMFVERFMEDIDKRCDQLAAHAPP
jgi:molecular chaperone HscB